MRKEIERSIGLVSCLLLTTELFAAPRKSSIPKATRRSSGPQTPTPPPGRSATLLPDGRVLLLGGEATDGVTNIAAFLDPGTGTVTTRSEERRVGREGRDGGVS